MQGLLVYGVLDEMAKTQSFGYVFAIGVFFELVFVLGVIIGLGQVGITCGAYANQDRIMRMHGPRYSVWYDADSESWFFYSIHDDISMWDMPRSCTLDDVCAFG